ncbi:VOC family protein [Nocardioides sp. KIGAM211]|uniref:VOC family protein n=1 Tax=Nocardioides luti TaxID=2761101 RepID=A0A7X0VCJ8_9ACTN|nr:VOC family protein [Nocardioides luti]MBB6629849.1 VOC family protein [Nocardioides luti]
MQAITPCLWFDDNLEEAMELYVKIFPDAAIGTVIRTGEGGPVLSGDWTMNGQTFRGINGGPMFAQFTEAISFSIDCEDQDEVDYYWENLAAGGEYSQCGWLKDRFGLSWQVVPRRLFELHADPNPARAAAAMQAMMGMQKLVVAELEAAADAAAPA